MARKTWAEKWGEEQPDYSMGKGSMKKLLKKVRTMTARRVQSLNKKNAFSYAAQQFNQSMKRTYLNGTAPSLENMTYRQMERELRMHHQFWSSKTATERGSRAEQVEQSKRIFGTDAKGRPIRVMTFEESKLFWSAYEEFFNMYKNSSAAFDSDRIQQAIGEAMAAEDGYFSPYVDLVYILDEAKETLKSRQELEELGFQFQSYDPKHPNKQWEPGQMTEKSWKKYVKEVYKGNGDALKR